MPKTKAPPVNLDKYLEGRNHKYMNYQQAARHYGLPYWGFVKVAKVLVLPVILLLGFIICTGIIKSSTNSKRYRNAW